MSLWKKNTLIYDSQLSVYKEILKIYSGFSVYKEILKIYNGFSSKVMAVFGNIYNLQKLSQIHGFYITQAIVLSDKAFPVQSMIKIL